MSINLQQLQQDARVWRQKCFPIEHRTAQLQVLGVCEETGELSHSVLKMTQGIRGTREDHIEKAKDAVGDIIIYLTGVCDALGLDLEDCVRMAWSEVEARDWSQHKDDGVGNSEVAAVAGGGKLSPVMPQSEDALTKARRNWMTEEGDSVENDTA